MHKAKVQFNQFDYKLYYIHVEITGDPLIRLAHTGTIYTQTAPLFSLNCIFSPANEEAVLKYNNQSDFKAFFEETNKIAGKWTTTSATFFKPPL